MTVFDATSVREAFGVVRAQIEAAGGGDDVAILPVTKGFGPEAIEAAIGAGAAAIGESYAQELVAKSAAMTPVAVHFIGQLQTNKVRLIADVVDLYETVDRAKLAREIAKRAPGAAVLLQVDTSGDPAKGGCSLSEVDALVDVARELGLAVRGLMTVGPTEGGAEAARPGFQQVRAAVDRLGLEVCSMGMTADLDVAVQEGTTQVRVGTALFGPRPVHTWRDQER